MTRTSGHALHTLIDATASNIYCEGCTFKWDTDTAAPPPTTFYLFNNGTSSTGFKFKDCQVEVDGASILQVHYLFNLTSGDGSTNIIDNIQVVATGSSSIYGFKATSGCTGATVMNSNFDWTAYTSSSQKCYYLDTGTATFWLTNNIYRFARD